MLRLIGAAASLALVTAAKDRAGPAGYGSKPHVSALISLRSASPAGTAGAGLLRLDRAAPGPQVRFAAPGCCGRVSVLVGLLRRLFAERQREEKRNGVLHCMEGVQQKANEYREYRSA